MLNMAILITPNAQYPFDKYDLQLHKITLCTLEQNIHVTHASAVRSGNMKKLSMKALYSHATYVNYKQPLQYCCTRLPGAVPQP